MKLYDGKGMLLGRLAAVVAKETLLGEEVKVVNCEKIIISGRKTNSFAAAKQKYERRGYPLKSANISRLPDRYVRRVIRGMLPWKQARGREAFKRVMCYINIPAEFKEDKLITIKEASASKLPKLRHTTIAEVCQHLGGKQR